MASRKSSAGERVLEGRHVIGLFFLMLLFSGVFFTLGYVMGRNQLDAQVRAASTHGNDTLLPVKPEPSAKPNKSPVSTPGNDPATDAGTPPSSEWEFYRAGDKNSSNDRLKPAPVCAFFTAAKSHYHQRKIGCAFCGPRDGCSPRNSAWVVLIAGRRPAHRVRRRVRRQRFAQKEISRLRPSAARRQILSRASRPILRPESHASRQEGPRDSRLQSDHQALMSASHWPDWLHPDSQKKFPSAFRLIVSAITGAGLALSFTWLYFPVYAWISIGLLLMMALGAKPRIAYFCGFCHALAFVFISLSWIAEVLAVHGGMSLIAGWAILALIAAVFGILTGGFTWTVNRIARRSIALACIAAPFVWVTSEFARAHLPEIGFPWNLLGYSAAANPALLQVTTVTGIYGLSFVIAGFNSLLAWADAAKTVSLKKRLSIIVAALAVILCVMFLGARSVPEAQAAHFARALQPNFPEVDSYPTNWFAIHKDDLDELHELSLQPSAHRPDLIIWPEAPAPFSWQDNQFSKRASSLAIRAQHPFLAGVIEWKAEQFSSGHIGQAPYNSALLVDPQGQKSFCLR